MNDIPLISVITVSYNAAAAIEETILSIINQSYKHIEYIIIDGGSTDGTVDIIKKYQHKIDYWVSEPDNGIYDAMNKGIDISTGEWINFMNTGDTFYDNSILSHIFEKDIPNLYSIIYGNTLFIYKTNQIIKNKGNKYMPSCHQSIFTRTSDIKNNKFDLQYKIAADYNYFHSLFSRNPNYLFVNSIISKYDATNGISSQNCILSFKEITHITYPYFISHLIIFFFYLKQFIKWILKKQITKRK